MQLNPEDDAIAPIDLERVPQPLPLDDVGTSVLQCVAA